jgi:hypothetical protein
MAWDSNSHQTESHANQFFFLATYPKNRRNTRKDDQILFRFSWIVMRIGTPNFSESTFPGSRIIDHLGSVIERYRKLECDPNPGIGTFSSKKSTIPPAALVFFALRNYVGSMIPLAIHQLKKILRDLSSGSVKAVGPFIVPWRCPGSTMGDPPRLPDAV